MALDLERDVTVPDIDDPGVLARAHSTGDRLSGTPA